MRAASDGLSVSGSGSTTDTANPIATTISAPSTTSTSEFSCHRMRRVTSAPARAIIAPPRGATTIAPMIAAMESWIRPKVAISAARASSTVKVTTDRRNCGPVREQVVQRGRAQRLAGVDEGRMGRARHDRVTTIPHRRHAASCRVARGRTLPCDDRPAGADSG